MFRKFSLTLIVAAAVFTYSLQVTTALEPNPLWTNGEQAISILPIGKETAIPAQAPLAQSIPLTVPESVEAEIAALASALGNDPVKIFNYVRNQIDYEHYYGLRKGSVLTLIEGSGNDFDQCALLADLLIAAGHTNIQYRLRDQRVDYSYLKNWMGLADEPWPGQTFLQATGQAITTVFANGTDNGVGDLVAKQAAWASTFLGERGSRSSVGIPAIWYPDFPAKANLVFHRMYLHVTIGGTSYDLDPSYKIYEKIDGLEGILAAAGYSRSALLTAAGGGTDPNYSLSLNETNIKNYLTGITTGLLAEISANHPDITLRELIGGKRIVKHEITHLNEAFPLPKVWYNTDLTWTTIPDSYKSLVRFQITGLNHSIYTSALNGRKISLTFAGNTVKLSLDDGTPVATTTVTATTFDMTMTVTHPGGGLAAMTETKTYKKNDNFAYAIIYGFSASGKLVQKRYEHLAAYLAEGKADSSPEVKTELLNIMGMTWLYQTALADKFLAAQNDIIPLSHHRFGRMSQEQGFYVDVGLQASSNVAHDGIKNDGRTDNVFHLGSLFASAMEHGIIEQLQPGSAAVSTVNILRKANTGGQRLYKATSANWSTVKAALLNYTTDQKNELEGYIVNYNAKLFLPQSATVTQGKWNGSGWVIRSPTRAGMIISGGYSGGYSTNYGYVSSPSIYSGGYYNPTYNYSPSCSFVSPFVPPSYTTPSFYGSDPVNMATGAFEYAHTDMETGIEAAPRGLSFARSYSSADVSEDRQNIGYGWSHSMHIRAAKRTATEEPLGLGTVQQAASFITATLVASDLYRDAASVREWGTAALTVAWYQDKMLENAVSITIGSNTFQYIKQPDGTWQAPAGSTMTLSVVSGNYIVSQPHGNTMHFQNTPSTADTSQCIQKIVDPDGKALTFIYHSDDRINYVQDAYGRRYTFGYTGTRITSITDNSNSPNTRSIGFRYDSGGNLDRVTDPDGKFNYFDYEVAGNPGGTLAEEHRIVRLRNHDGAIITENVYDSLGRVTEQFLHGDTNKTWKLRYTGTVNTEEDPEGGITEFYYDERGRSTGKRDPSGIVESWKYDGQDRMIEKTTGSGEITIHHYDVRHNLTKIDHPRGGGSTQMFYDSLNRLDLVIDPDGNQTDHVYNVGNTKARPDRIIDPAGTTTFVYKTTGPALGRIWKITDPDNLLTEHEYDLNGHPDWIKAPGGFQTQYTFTQRGDLLDLTDSNNVTTAYLYNNRRQVTKITSDSGGASQSAEDYVYNNQGLLERKTDAADNGGQRFSSRYQYSPTEKPLFTRTSDNDGEGANDPVTQVSYDGRDWQSQIIDPASRLTTFTPKANGQPWQTTIPLGRVKTQVEDGDGRPVSGTAPGSNGNRSSGLAYDVAPSGYPRTITTTADNLSVSEVQDRSGNPRFYTNRKSKVWEFRYDGLGRRTHVITPLDAANNRSHLTEYFPRGAVKKVTEPSGQVTNFNYNATSGRLTTVTDNVGTISHTSYDNNGNLLTTSESRTGVTGAKTTNRTYDRQGRLASRTDENGQTIGYRYYSSGKVRKIIYPGGTESGVGHVEYTWWQDGNLKQVIDKLDSTTTPRITSFVWQTDGRLRKVTRPNNTVREIKYDAAGRPDLIEEYGPGMELIFVHKHGYYPSDEMEWRYELPSKSTSGTSPPPMSAMTYNADNQLATWGGQSITHDPDGNMTSGPNISGTSLASYSYDARNRLSAALGTSYVYDADGQRVGKTHGAEVTTFAVDVGSALSKVLVRTTNGVPTRYVWGLGLLYEVNGSGGSATTVSYHHDATGSTIALTDDTATVIERIGYTPWGQINHRVNLTGTAHDTPFLFTGFFGNQTDANGLLYMRNRYYHPLIGRFLNADPAQEGMNWYGYGGGNPIGMVDPMGLGITGAIDMIQSTLSFLGMVPVFGALFDVVNAGISLARGNYVDAALSFASSIPGIGDLAGGAKLIGAGAAAYGGYKGFTAVSRSWSGAANGGGKFTVGAYNDIRGTVSGLDAHHVGQQALMKRLVPGYDAGTAPSILVPKVGHTIRGPNGIVSRSTSGLDNVRDVIARDINELRRVYPDVPNPQLQDLIQMNKNLYPNSFVKP